MIRPAQEQDLRTLTELAEQYHKEHWFGKHSKFDAEHTFQNFRAYYIGMIANVLVAECKEHGIIGFCVAFLVPLHWTPQIRCTIGYSYINKDHRKDGVFGELLEVAMHFLDATFEAFDQLVSTDGVELRNTLNFDFEQP